MIEMLIATILIGVVSLVIYSSLSEGIKIWQRVNREIPDEDLNLCFEKISRDFNNCVKLSKIKFSGSKTELRFATLVSSPSKLPGLQLNVGEVTYSFDKEKEALVRTQKNFSQFLNELEVPKALLLSTVKSLRFQYYFYDKLEEAYLWQEEWLEEGSPLAVRVEFEFGPESQSRQFIRTFSIPVGG